jgi:hypothetical protein
MYRLREDLGEAQHKEEGLEQDWKVETQERKT